MSRYFLGAKKMGDLGLPTDIRPWYPLATLVPRFVAYTGQRLVPSLAIRQEQRGRAVQQSVLTSMDGNSKHGG